MHAAYQRENSASKPNFKTHFKFCKYWKARKSSEISLWLNKQPKRLKHSYLCKIGYIKTTAK